jgi:hypothetical protein
MLANDLLHYHLIEECPEIHSTRLQSLMDVAGALQKSKNLSLTAMGRELPDKIDIKHRIKKVDRLEGNEHLYKELQKIYEGLSNYVFKYLSYMKDVPIVIDLCFMKDDRDIQMLSAEIATRGRTLPLYREIFKSGELSGRAESFISNLLKCIPGGKDVVVIMDAGFSEDWFVAVEKVGWYWLARVRQGKKLKLDAESEWVTVKDFIPEIGVKAKNYNNAQIMKTHEHSCRIITKRKSGIGKKKKTPRMEKNSKTGSGSYSSGGKEPWILATNLPLEYTTTRVVLLYKKRMQIEESFRDIKSHQYGLSGRYVQTVDVNRWGVKMLLAAISQIVFWVIGIIGHSQGFQRKFQANTVRDKKVFSYFYLGQLIVEHNVFDQLEFELDELPDIIEKELARDW